MKQDQHAITSNSRSRFASGARWLGCLSLIGAVAVLPARAAEPQVSAPGALTILARDMVQDQGAWLVTYRLRHDGATGVVVTPTDIHAKLEGWVSNSRVGNHAIPRLATVIVSGASGPAAAADVIPAAEEAQRCRERVVLQAWTDDPSAGGEDAQAPAPPVPTVAGRVGAVERQPILSIAPGASVRVRLRIEHLHFIHGDYDPLLGARNLELSLAGASMRDVLPLDQEQYLAMPRFAWPEPPEDRRDPRMFLSAPDSLRLEAHVPGNQYYRFAERPVRYGTRMRLRFAYFIAAGSEGQCRARVAQYKDTPTSWKVLSEGGFEQPLKTVGHWTRVEKVFTTESEATLLALDFSICGAEVGEAWIDDVSLEPVGPTVDPNP